MLLGCIADDFTGAGDLANTLSRGGMYTVQLVGVPDSSDATDADAGVIALKTRSVPAGQAVQQSLDALRWLQAQGCEQFLFKYCSTFDSTPEGNIGPVAEALLSELGGQSAIVCPSFPQTGRTVYQGHLFVKDALLNQSGMERHPLNPMTDPDIRRWLRRQTRGGVGHIALSTVQSGVAALQNALREQEIAGARLIVVDAVGNQDLFTLGAALKDQKLVTGGSGIALQLPQNFRDAGHKLKQLPTRQPVTGPGVVLSGSCSAASLQQVQRYGTDQPTLLIKPVELLSGQMTVKRALHFVLEKSGQGTAMVYSSADATDVASTQESLGRERTAAAVEGFFGELALALWQAGTRRFVVGGGETSGAVVSRLPIRRLTIGEEIDPGVPSLWGEIDGEPIGMALKSGNFGKPDFYEKALRLLESAV